MHAFGLVLAIAAVVVAFYVDWMDQRPQYLIPSGYVWIADSSVYYTPGGEIYLDEGWSAVFKKTDVTAEIDGVTWMVIRPVQGTESHVWAEEDQLREVMEVTRDKLRGEVLLDYDYASCTHFRLKKDSELYGGIDPCGEKEQLLMVVPEGTIFYNEDVASDTFSGEVYWRGSYYYASGYVDEKNLEWMYTVY